MNYDLTPIKRAMAEKAKDQSWVAYKIGRSVSTVSLTLAGLRSNPKTIKAMADLFKVAMSDIVQDEPEAKRA